MQINVQIFALIRIPRDEGVFEEVTMIDKLRASLQTRLLETMDAEAQRKSSEEGDEGKENAAEKNLAIQMDQV